MSYYRDYYIRCTIERLDLQHDFSGKDKRTGWNGRTETTGTNAGFNQAVRTIANLCTSFIAAKDEFDPLGSSICSEKKRE
jgi:hypothetical protein